MNVNKAMEKLVETRAKHEMRSNEFGKRLDDILTAIEELVMEADENQLAQLSRVGGEVTRIAENQLSYLQDEDEDEDTDDEWE